MRNSKVKGFTLIELIVVIAIIGVLAAILVPSMLGYVRNARISSANANAKQVHTAVSSALTQLGIANFAFGDTTTGTSDIAQVDLTISGSGSTATIACTFGSDVTAPSDEQMDLVSYLGENFTGIGRAFFNKSTYSVIVAAWASKEADIDVAGSSADDLSTVTEPQQKSDAKDGHIYGIFPAPKLS